LGEEAGFLGEEEVACAQEVEEGFCGEGVEVWVESGGALEAVIAWEFAQEGAREGGGAVGGDVHRGGEGKRVRHLMVRVRMEVKAWGGGGRGRGCFVRQRSFVNEMSLIYQNLLFD